MTTAAAPSLPPATPIASEIIDAVGDVPLPSHATMPRVTNATAASSPALLTFRGCPSFAVQPSHLLATNRVGRHLSGSVTLPHLRERSHPLLRRDRRSGYTNRPRPCEARQHLPR